MQTQSCSEATSIPYIYTIIPYRYTHILKTNIQRPMKSVDYGSCYEPLRRPSTANQKPTLWPTSAEVRSIPYIYTIIPYRYAHHPQDQQPKTNEISRLWQLLWAVTSTVISQSEADIMTDLSRGQIDTLYIYNNTISICTSSSRTTTKDQWNQSIMTAVSPEIIAVVRYTQHGNYPPQRIDGTTEGRGVEPLRWVFDGMYSSSPHRTTTDTPTDDLQGKPSTSE